MSPRLFALALLVLGAAAQTTAGAAAEAAHERLVIGVSQFPSNFNPLINGLVVKSYVLGAALRPLTAYDKDWKLVCVMCDRLPTIENGLARPERQPDGRMGIAVTLTLPAKAKWADGVPVTSADVVFTWNVGRHPDSGVSNGDAFRRIRAIDVKDDRTFTLHLDKLTFNYNDLGDFQILPAHLERAAFADPKAYRNRSLYEAATTNPGLYDGPYRIADVARGQYVVLERNPYWWGRPPAFRQVVIRTIEATPALEANLLAGGVDMIAGEIGLSMDGALAFEARHRPEWRVIYKPGLSYEHITLNVDNPVLADRRVRQALLYGLPRQAMVHRLFQDRQPVADTLVNPLDWCYDPNVPKYGYDPAKAARLLDEAGWRLGADGLRRDARGRPLEFELMTTAGNRTREVMELVIQQEWRRLGIRVSLRNQPARTLFGDTVLRHAFRDMALFAWVSAPENVPRSQLRSDMVPTAANNYAGENAGGYRNPAMDKLIDAIEVELDRDKRRVLWSRLQRLYAEDLPELPLTFRADPFVLPLWLKGVEPTGHQYPTTLWIEDWRADGG